MNRLELIASLTNGYDSLADIGSDHAYVCIESVLKYGIRQAYACDINEGPLLNAKNNIKNYHLEEKIKTILSNGLIDFNYDVDLIVISGMGGSLICDILNNSLDKVNKAKRLILQPNSDVEKVRFFLNENNYTIVDELLIKDKKHYYQILIAEKTQNKVVYNKLDIKYGPILRIRKDELFKEMYERKLSILTKNLSKTNSEQSINNLQNEINEIKGVLHE